MVITVLLLGAVLAAAVPVGPTAVQAQTGPPLPVSTEPFTPTAEYCDLVDFFSSPSRYVPYMTAHAQALAHPSPASPLSPLTPDEMTYVTSRADALALAELAWLGANPQNADVQFTMFVMLEMWRVGKRTSLAIPQALDAENLREMVGVAQARCGVTP